jgi:hypothetical protein
MCFQWICRADRMARVSLVSGRQVDSRVELVDGWDACLVAATYFRKEVIMFRMNLSITGCMLLCNKRKRNSVAWVRELIIPAELVGEVSANFCGWTVSCGQRDGSLRPYSRVSRPEPLFFFKQLLNCTPEAEWISFLTYYFSKHLVVSGIEPRPLDLQPGTLTTTPQRRWSRSRSRSYFTTDSQSVSMSWHRVPLWDLQPDIISCRNVAVWNLRSCIYWAPSLTRVSKQYLKI